METFIVLTKLTPKGKYIVQNYPEKIKLSTNEINRLGGEIVSQYALLGPYDFITILKAENEHVIYKITSEISALGTVESISMPGISIDKFTEIIKGK